MSKITKENVQYIARLSRIHLGDDELSEQTSHLEQILKYINKLENLDVTDIKPTSHVLSLENVYREDTVKPSLDQADALKIAVSQLNGSFKVPQVIE